MYSSYLHTYVFWVINFGMYLLLHLILFPEDLSLKEKQE